MIVLTRAIGARRVFELGSGYGYSALHFARAVGEGGQVHCTELSAENVELARGFLGRAGVWERVTYHQEEATAAPATARVKDRLTVRGTLQAQRFQNRRIEVWLYLDDQPAMQNNPGDLQGKPVKITVEPKSVSETIPIEMPPFKLPDAAGDYRLTLKAVPPQGEKELTDQNNTVSTYISLTKDGLSVMYFDKRRYESRFLSEALKKRAFEFKMTPMVGRTHGVHAEPTTFGLVLALFYAENKRNTERLRQARKTVSVGKISGAGRAPAACGSLMRVGEFSGSTPIELEHAYDQSNPAASARTQHRP